MAVPNSFHIGFMQGRLSPMINGKIQSFPWDYWKNEFMIGAEAGFSILEWTVDNEGFRENPLLTVEGRREINRLKQKHGINIPSLTADCFMQAPFFKASGKRMDRLLADFADLVHACGETGIRQILIPLVDDGRIETVEQKSRLSQGLREIEPLLEQYRVSITFESDWPPVTLSEFLHRWNPKYFGVTYDIGNSAALGYHPAEEIGAYGHRIINVHVKDRIYKGGTVPLGKGNADIPLALKLILNSGYTGNYILQTARATDEDHTGVLIAFKNMVEGWLVEGMV